MWPRSREGALVSTLQAEKATTLLVQAAYDSWLPRVELALTPGVLTASGELPDPQGVEQTSPWWQTLLDHLVVYGVGLVFGWELLGALAALGDMAPLQEHQEEERRRTGGTTPDTIRVSVTAVPEGLAPDSLAAQARTLVARALSLKPAQVRQLDRDLAAIPTIRELQRTHLATVRNRLGDTPNTVFRDITTQLDQGLAAGEGVDQMRDRVRTFLTDTTAWRNRAELVARTETTSAMSWATEEAARYRSQVLGVQYKKAWIATTDTRTRPSHRKADQQEVPLNGRFHVGRVDMERPGDPKAPVEEVANCRCRLVILAEEETLPPESDRGMRNLAASMVGDKFTEHVLAEAGLTPTENRMATYRAFTAILAVIGTPTDDRRMFAKDIDLRFREFPLPVMWQKQTETGHYNSFTVGVLESASVEGNQVVGSGYFLNSPEADEAYSQATHGVTNPSVDLGDAEWMMTDEAGNKLDDQVLEALFWGEGEEDLKVYETVTSAVLMGFTLVATPAFSQSRISPQGERELEDALVASALVAAATHAPQTKETAYDPALFANPQLEGPTPVTYDEATGRVFGHLACFGVCHIGIADRCVMAPRSKTNYAHFHTSPPVLLEGGERLPVGRLTVGTGHAAAGLSAGPAAAHYDDTGTTWAMVRVGEDAHGIWFSGVVAPWADARSVQMGLHSPISGDWRTIGGHLELVAALNVNTPGFPILGGREDSEGRPMTLVASLGPRANRQARQGTPPQLLAHLVAQEVRKLQRREKEAQHLVTSVLGHRRKAAQELVSKISKRGT